MINSEYNLLIAASVKSSVLSIHLYKSWITGSLSTIFSNSSYLAWVNVNHWPVVAFFINSHRTGIYANILITLSCISPLMYSSAVTILFNFVLALPYWLVSKLLNSICHIASHFSVNHALPYDSVHSTSINLHNQFAIFSKSTHATVLE